jgi:hypothetical protein
LFRRQNGRRLQQIGNSSVSKGRRAESRWTVVQPVNRHGFETVQLTAAAGRFFDTGRAADNGDWVALRNRWEAGHVCRAVFATAGLILTALSLTAR